MRMCGQEHVYVELEVSDRCFPLLLSTLSFETGRSSLSLELITWLVWLASQPQRFILLSLCTALEPQMHLSCPDFYHGAGGLGTGPHASRASALPTEPSPPPYNNISICFYLSLVIQAVLRIKPKTLYTLVRCSTTELHPQLLNSLIFFYFVISLYKSRYLISIFCHIKLNYGEFPISFSHE